MDLKRAAAVTFLGVLTAIAIACSKENMESSPEQTPGEEEQVDNTFLQGYWQIVSGVTDSGEYVRQDRNALIRIDKGAIEVFVKNEQPPYDGIWEKKLAYRYYGSRMVWISNDGKIEKPLSWERVIVSGLVNGKDLSQIDYFRVSSTKSAFMVLFVRPADAVVEGILKGRPLRADDFVSPFEGLR